MTLEYIRKIEEICADIQKHGYGEVKIHFEDKGYKVKIVIEAGKSYVYFIEKPPRQFDSEIVM